MKYTQALATCYDLLGRIGVIGQHLDPQTEADIAKAITAEQKRAAP